MVYRVLGELREKYPKIKAYRVLSYKPKLGEETPNSIVPEGIELIYPEYAIIWRNRWLTKHSDYAVVYVTDTAGDTIKLTWLDEIENRNT